MKLVSRCWMSTRRKDISLRVFSKMTRGSSERQRRQLGAITMARLLTSILVMATFAGCTNTCSRGGGRGGEEGRGGAGLEGRARGGTRGASPGRGSRGVPGAGLEGRARDGARAHLEEADEVAQHQAVDARQGVHYGHGGLGALVVRDALLVELVRDQGLLQLPVPELQQGRCEHGGAQRGPGGARWSGVPA